MNELRQNISKVSEQFDPAQGKQGQDMSALASSNFVCASTERQVLDFHYLSMI